MRSVRDVLTPYTPYFRSRPFLGHAPVSGPVTLRLEHAATAAAHARAGGGWLWHGGPSPQAQTPRVTTLAASKPADQRHLLSRRPGHVLSRRSGSRILPACRATKPGPVTLVPLAWRPVAPLPRVW